ncbi:MAG TPA: apolipoprotein N-acyltransferase [Acidiphilium sp.]|nr:MAG: apolipoprotein N-acyltransferase [Acidiphilium sp. 21-60-14]OYV92011.1 MAG: apolipoprotein N-acyltransferase [Acidiphilium sp. 37-60-79]OZB39323.1 MAG: apolipoprotein N-acyltransferase [Acidiphilium sp. 34-60-192]HQT89170.1 apolipoprotein N-acyltransferase [Acidiphilium sp.]HQU24189.1 apolipoprotein N-acyltransferase [Acidiphilium sp.]
MINQLRARIPQRLRSPAWAAFGFGLLAALALPPFYGLPLLWLVVPGLLRLLTGASSWRQALWRGFCFGFGFNLLGLFWVTEPMLITIDQFWWAIPFAAPGLAAAVALYMLIPALLVYRLKPGFGLVLVFAGIMVLMNLAQQFLFTGFPWNYWGTDWAIPGRIGTVMIQPAALIGMHGLTLLTIILAGLPLCGPRGWAGAAVLLMAWTGFGLARVAGGPAAERNLTIAMIQPDFAVPGSFTPAALQARWQRDLQMTQQAMLAAGPGPKAIIWPETASPALLQTDVQARAAIASITGDTPVFAGSFRFTKGGHARNSLVVVRGAGPIAGYYDKWKLVPFGEYTPAIIPFKITPGGGFTPGPGPRTLHVPGIPPVGPLICYESIFSGEIIDRTDRPDWLVNISDNAWFGDTTGPRQDFATTRLRAVEEGLPLIVDTNSGVSAFIGPHGTVQAQLGLDQHGILVHKLQVALPTTIFGRFGLTLDWTLSALSIIFGFIVVGFERFLRQRQNKLILS